MNIYDLREAQVRYENKKDEILKLRKELYQLRSLFTSFFNLSRIQNMSIDDYVLGVELPKKGYNFCYAIERKLDGLGRIIGANAFKFGVYYGKTKTDEKYKYRFTKKFGETHQKAFENVKKSIMELLVAGENEDIDAIAKNILSPMFKGKILSTYFPDRFLNVFSPDHLNYFLTQLDLDSDYNIQCDAVYKREVLIKFKNQDKVMKKWPLDLFSNFLYTEYPGRPPKEEQNVKKQSDPLEDYRQPKFPSNPRPTFIELDVLPPSLKNKKKSKKITYIGKPNYEKEARKLKKLGYRGEKIVIDLEKERLIKSDRKDLADKIERVSLKSDSIGYDILSYESDGRMRYIEVKATHLKVGNANFFYTTNELMTAQQLNNYFIYMVYDVTSKNPKVWAIKNPFNPENKNAIKTPLNYRVTINTKKPTK